MKPLPTAFEKHAQERQPGMAAEFVRFALANRKWWLIPIALALLLAGLLVVLGGSGVAPFIYTLF